MSNEHSMGASDIALQIATPDGDNSSLVPRTATEFTTPSVDATNSRQFSARVDSELLRQVKIEVATRGTTLQAATAEAFRLWLSSRPGTTASGVPADR
ncbi:MAG: hypothetical protein WAW17_23405 [Rhodococcus sp. (in: high G+C Gram-positive bacteria)]